MAKQDINKLKDWFRTGNFPTQEQFWDWIDSFVHKDDKLGITANFPELDQVLQQKAEKSAFIHHTNDHHNPHQVSKAQVGLGSVDNTADADKPISRATQSALDMKGSKNILDDHLADQSNPHGVTKMHLGLANVDNTADGDKPISKAVQAALDLKAEQAHTHSVTSLTGFDTDVTLAADSDKKVASQKAVKAYVDDQVKGKLQGQLSLVSPQTNHVFSSQKSHSELFLGKQNGYIEVTTDATPAGILSTWGLGRLHALIQIEIDTQGVPASKFGITTDVYLQLKNGFFSFRDENNTWQTDSTIRIAVISFASGRKLKEIDIPIISSFVNIDENKKGSSITFSGLNDIDGKKSDFKRTAVLKNSTKTEIMDIEEASFCLLVKSNMTTTKTGDMLSNHIHCFTAISSFTLSRINAMPLPN